MMGSLFRLGPIALTGALLFSCPATTQADGSRVAGGLAVYLGVVPAEVVHGPGRDVRETAMHRHQAPRSGDYHVMIAVFDAKTGARISDATATASVAALGMAPVVKPLEAMTVAGAASYGNYFPMLGSGPFLIKARILLQGAKAAIDVEFEHRHQ